MSPPVCYPKGLNIGNWNQVVFNLPLKNDQTNLVRTPPYFIYFFGGIVVFIGQ